MGSIQIELKEPKIFCLNRIEAGIMCAVKKKLRHSSLGPYPQRIKIGIFVLFVCGTFHAGFNQQDLAYAIPEPSNISSVDTKNLQKSNEHTFSIMQEQLRAYREKLQESERKLEDFQQAHGIISLESQIDLLLQQRKALDDSLMSTRNQSKGFQEKLAWVKGQISQVPKEVPLSSTISEQGIIGSAKSNLLGLQLKEQQLLTKYTESSPHVQSLREEMDVIARFIKDQEERQAGSVTSGKNPVYSEMEMVLFRTKADLVSAEAQSAVISQQIERINKELERLRGLKPGLDGLRRQVTADEKNYINYLTKVGTTPPQDYKIQVGDQLDIKFFFNPELNETVLVRPDGRIALQLVGEMSVVGLSVEQIRTILIKSYSGQLKNPEVAVLLRSSTVSIEGNSTTGGDGGP